MQTYKNFNRDQINVLETQLSLVSEQLVHLEDSLAGDAQLTLDFGEFTSAIATLTTVLRKANVRPIKKATVETRLQPVKPRPRKPKSKKSDFICRIPTCRKTEHYARGLCRNCYNVKRKNVANGSISWEEIESDAASNSTNALLKNDTVNIAPTTPKDTPLSPLNQAV